MALILTGLSGCLTRPPQVQLPVITEKTADLTITLKPLSYDELKERHGSNRRDKLNPFIDYPGQVPQRRIIVFDAEFSTEESTILFNIRDIKLAIGDETGKAASIEYLIRLWDVYNNKTAFSKTIPDKARRYMLPREFTVKPGENIAGYLVFAEPFPKIGGEGLLTIPVTTDSGDTGTIEIKIDFDSNEGTEEETENTGIFAEEGA